MNLEVITVQECIDMFVMKEQCSIIADGQVIGFEDKNSTAGFFGENRCYSKGNKKLFLYLF